MAGAFKQSWGTLHKLPSGGDVPAIKFVPNVLNVEQICWLPRVELRHGLPEAAVPKFFVVERRGANAAVIPVDDVTSKRDPLHNFFHMAWHFGWKIDSKENPEQWNTGRSNSYSTMWFLYRRFHRTNASPSRRFNTKKDFLNTSRELILPWEDGDGETVPSGVRRLAEFLKSGETRAVELGIENARYAQKLHYGLAAAARNLNWAGSNSDAVSQLIKNSLLIRRNDTELHSVTREKIEEELIDALMTAVKSDRDIRMFDEWLLGSSNTLAKKLSKALSVCEGSALDCVHQYLGESGIAAMKYIAPFIRTLMADLERCLDDAEIEFDRELFRMLYYPQPYFDNLPLIFLREKLEFFEGTVESLRIHDERAVGEFHAMLWFYGRMVEDRRRTDRERSVSAEVHLSVTGWETQAPSTSSEEIDVDRLVEMLRDSGELDCDCDQPQWTCSNLEVTPMVFRCRSCQSEYELGNRDAC